MESTIPDGNDTSSHVRQLPAQPGPADAGAARPAGSPARAAIGAAPAPRPLAARSGSRVAILDGLRLVAALMVVAYHYIALGQAWTALRPHGFPAPVYWLSEYGFLGVELFFLISGFVICMSSIGRGLGDFFVARVTRLYPAYWFAVLATTAVVTALPGVDHHLGARDTLTNLSMLQIPLHVPDVDGVYWTLWAEMRFYLLFAIVVGLGVTYRRVLAFCMLWTVAAIVTVDHGGPLLHMIFLPYQAPYFTAGIAFFLIHRYGSSALPWAVIGLQFILAVHYLGVDGRIRNKFAYVPGWFAVLLVAVFFLVMALVATGVLRARWRAMTVAGSLTYPLYLLHQHIGWAVIDRLQRDLPPTVLVSVVTAGMLALAYGVHRLVERPLARRMRPWLHRAVATAARPAGGMRVRQARRNQPPAAGTPPASTYRRAARTNASEYPCSPKSPR